jgi:hypothetical protein
MLTMATGPAIAAAMRPLSRPIQPLARPIRRVLRASGGARARSAAPVSDVWDILAHPGRWAAFDPFVESVELQSDSDAPAAVLDESAIASVGQVLHARLRLLPLRVAMEVDHVVNRSSLAVTMRLLPGLAEEFEYFVIPASTGGSFLTVRFTLHGPLAVPALLPRWLVRALTVRLLAYAAEGRLRELSREATSVA